MSRFDYVLTEQVKEVVNAYIYLFMEDETQTKITAKYRFYLILTTIPCCFYCILFFVYYHLKYRRNKSPFKDRRGSKHD